MCGVFLVDAYGTSRPPPTTHHASIRPPQWGLTFASSLSRSSCIPPLSFPRLWPQCQILFCVAALDSPDRPAPFIIFVVRSFVPHTPRQKWAPPLLLSACLEINHLALWWRCSLSSKNECPYMAPLNCCGLLVVRCLGSQVRKPFAPKVPHPKTDVSLCNSIRLA